MVRGPCRTKEGFETEHGSVTVTKSDLPEGPAGYVHGFNVKADKRGLGEGISLGRAVINEADEEGRTLFTHARPELHRVYGRAGFQIAEDHPHDFLGGKQPFLVRQPRKKD